MYMYSIICRSKEKRCLFLWKRWTGWRGRAPLMPAAAEYGKENSVYRRHNRGVVWPRLMAPMRADPDLSAMFLDGTVARVRGRGQQSGSGSRARSQPGRLQHPDPPPDGSTGSSPRPAHDSRHTQPQPHAPVRYRARNTVTRGIGRLKLWRCVATRYAPYADRGLGFPYLAGALI